jgi:hypothetical protein
VDGGGGKEDSRYPSRPQSLPRIAHAIETRLKSANESRGTDTRFVRCGKRRTDFLTLFCPHLPISPSNDNDGDDEGDNKIERGLNYESMQDERHYKKVQLRLDDLVLPRLLALALPLHLSHPLRVHFPTHSAPSPTTTRASLTLL